MRRPPVGNPERPQGMTMERARDTLHELLGEGFPWYRGTEAWNANGARWLVVRVDKNAVSFATLPDRMPRVNVPDKWKGFPVRIEPA